MYKRQGKNSSYLKVASNKKLSKASSKSLLSILAKLPNTKHRTGYFGPRTSADLGTLIGLGSKHKAAKKQHSIRFNKQKKSTIFFIKQKVAQAQVRIAYPAKELSNADTAKASLFNRYVGGGMGGLIFQEIREARGLAYSAWTYYMRSTVKGDESGVIAGLGTQADKSVEAVSTLLSLISPLIVEKTRFNTASTSLDAVYRKTRFTPRSRAGVLFGWEDRGLMSDPRPEEYKALQATSPEDMQTFANARTKVAPVIAISGDSERIDLKEVAKAAKSQAIKTLSVDQLFGY